MVLQDRFGVSERRACAVVGQYRSTQRRPCRPRPVEEDKLRRRLRVIARAHPRWGWKTAHRLLLREGWSINRKRTQRLWREEGLRRPQQCRKRRRGPDGERQCATRANEVWAADFQFDETADGRRLKMLNIVDEYTRGLWPCASGAPVAPTTWWPPSRPWSPPVPSAHQRGCISG